MSKKTVQILLGALVLLLIGGGAYYYLQNDSPEMTFIKIKRSIDNKDLETFNQCVDVDQVVNSVIDQYIQYMTTKNNGELDIATGLIAFMRPSIIEMVKQEIQNNIEQGKIEIPTEVSISSEVLGLMTLANGDGANFKGVKDRKVTENQAEITFIILLDGATETNEVPVKFRKTATGWQIYDILNLGPLADTYAKTQQQ
ncbi:hypothetical protein [Flammeovirga sp. SJP92]|uniref:hypothetical protein n=1 Tax=Flammeovirga sp. SJP92 TaxID=1775430 RepID=UPI0007871EF0|nr:hypothetical protein [Flammeovirga sp. SJP92]KXX68918.1 hypothetical protein AVL50_17310 [Flammeovirga sp. SJP92]